MYKRFYLILLAIFNILSSEIPECAWKIMPPPNIIYHPVSTLNEHAQESFNRGLTYIFAFNHDIAFREFENASKFDPNLAMAYWGMALALGQNMNQDISPTNEIRCYHYIQKAVQLAPSASPEEQAYISALSSRYTDNPSADLIALRFRYRDAMKKVVDVYPEDLDAATMYAESVLNLDPWKWWTPQGMPKEGTLEAISVLESVLMRNPEHIGANHYYIHAWEESPTPERALMSAHRLEYLLPEAGHLLHMPCHIFLLVGDYESALKTNKNGIFQDRKYINEYGIDSGPYPLHYLTHNLYILTRTYMLMEDYDNAIKAAYELFQFIEPHAKSHPHLALHYFVPLQIYLYFHRWKEILDYSFDSTYPPAVAFLHFSRGVAFASLGDIPSAQREKKLMLEVKQKITPEDQIANNPANRIFDLAEIMLEASIAEAEKNSDYTDYLKKGIEIQDTLEYDEPPGWYLPIRQTLGFTYLKQNRYQDAEKLFKTSLDKLHRNGRSLFGLYLSLKGQNRTVDAYWVEREMTTALKHASYRLTLDNP